VSFETILAIWALGATSYIGYLLNRGRALRSDAARAKAEMDAAYRALDDTERQRDMQRRRADEFFGLIQGVEAEADMWRKLYRRGMSQAGVAQNWLIRDLSEVVRAANAYAARLRKHGEKVLSVQVSPELKRFIEDFEQQTNAEVPRAPGHAEAERLEREIVGPAALNEPIEATSPPHDPA